MQQILVFFPTFLTKLFVVVAIPDAWFKKLSAVLSAVRIVFLFAIISAIILFFFIDLPSFIFDLNNVSFPISLNACLQKSIPATTPFCLAIILAFIFLLFNSISLVVISPIGLRSSSKAFLTTELIYFWFIFCTDLTTNFGHSLYGLPCSFCDFLFN